MKYLLPLLFLVGCTVLPAKTVEDKEQIEAISQDAQFEVALDDLIKTSHQEEMTALDSQKEILERIETSVEALATPEVITPTEPVKSADEPTERPKLWVTYADFKCPPCDRLKGDIEEGKLDGFEIVLEDKGDGLKSTRPAIRFLYAESSTGYGVIYEYSDSVLNWLNDSLLQGDLQSRSTETETTGEHTVITFSEPAPVRSAVKSKSVTRVSGSSWNWEGNWNPSIEFMRQHLMDDHGIDATGMSPEEMQILHDNAHNSTSVVKTKYSSSSNQRTTRSIGRSRRTRGGFLGIFSYRSRSSCPGGSCP